jgi:hypothetical protein
MLIKELLLAVGHLYQASNEAKANLLQVKIYPEAH